MNKDNKVAIFYHKADLDGVMSGVVAHHYLKARLTEYIELCPVDYGEDFEDKLARATDYYDKFYVLDISDEKFFRDHGSKIIWIDHHEPVRTLMPPVRDTFFMDGVAACRLTFSYMTDVNYPFYDKNHYVARLNTMEPLCITLAGEYDIWDKGSALVDKFNLGCEDLSFEAIKFLFESTKGIHAGPLKSQDAGYLKSNKDVCEHGKDWSYINHIIAKGDGILEYIRNTHMRVKPSRFTYMGLTGVAFNTHIKNSMIYNLKDGEDFLAIWNVDGETGKVSMSLRANGKTDADVSEIARKFGGGGHKKAAGCKMSMASLFEMGIIPLV